MLLTVIPIYNSNKEFSGTETALSVAFFLYILAMAVLFDIKDISIDDYQKRTIPKIAGIKNTQRLSLLLTSISMSIMICFYTDILWYVLLLFTMSGIVIYHAPKWTKEFHYSLFIDGVLYLPGIMALISVIF
ncbi:MAG: hypothetical protein IPM77_04390 [Crocinitomicaceae bacterium]|nr:hypothetical protein [Crocinitomicaceae bacterium]